MHMKGLDDRRLSTSGNSLTMGENNRAFILDFPYDDTTYWSYWHNYFDATLTFDVDVSDVGCDCAAGLHLVALNDETCGWDAIGDDSAPQCQTIDLMKANKYGHNTAAHPCEAGVCEQES